MNEILDRFHTETGSAERGNDAGGHGLAKTERIADCDNEIAHAQLLGIGERNVDQVFRRHLDHGDIGVRITADDGRAELAPVGQRHVDFVGILDHVVIGQDQPARGVDDDAGAETRGLLDAFYAGHVEKAPEQRVAWQRQLDPATALAARGDIDHGRRGALEHRRKTRQRLTVNRGGKGRLYRHAEREQPGCDQDSHPGSIKTSAG